ncbi:MAG: GNAT family N-acetyltransferase [Marinomonas sp.]
MNTQNIGFIRTAVLEDAPAILAIFQQCDPFAVAEKRQNSISLIDVMEWLDSASGNHPMLVLEDQGRAIAWCSIEPFYGLPAFDRASEISLYVACEYQRKSLGKQLIRYLELHQPSLGFTHLIAYIYASNVASQCFFRRQGFEQWGLLPNIAHNAAITEDVYLLGREFTL